MNAPLWRGREGYIGRYRGGTEEIVTEVVHGQNPARFSVVVPGDLDDVLQTFL